MANNLLGVVDNKKYENILTPYHLSSEEEEWMLGAAKHHSYFKVELMGDNTIKNAYFMDASGAENVTDVDKEQYNFERRLNDDGVVQKKIKLKKFLKLWNKYLTVALDGNAGIEYVKNEKHQKIYRCRPFGWVLQAIQEDTYGK